MRSCMAICVRMCSCTAHLCTHTWGFLHVHTHGPFACTRSSACLRFPTVKKVGDLCCKESLVLLDIYICLPSTKLILPNDTGRIFFKTLDCTFAKRSAIVLVHTHNDALPIPATLWAALTIMWSHPRPKQTSVISSLYSELNDCVCNNPLNKRLASHIFCLVNLTFVINLQFNVFCKPKQFNWVNDSVKWVSVIQTNHVILGIKSVFSFPYQHLLLLNGEILKNCTFLMISWLS